MSDIEQGLEKKVKPKKKRKLLFRLAVFLFIVLLTVACSFFSYNYVMKNLNDSNKNVVIKIDSQKAIKFEIPLGSTTASISNLLNEKGIIRFPYIFKLMSRINGYDGRYKSGTHVISKDLDYDNLMRVLTDNPLNKPSISVTIPEGLTYKQTLDLFVKEDIINIDKFNKAAESKDYDYRFLASIPKREHRLEGYLFPETYFFEVGGEEKDVINIILRQFNKIFTQKDYERAKELKMTPDQIIILASIIEREAKLDSERSIIAGVLYNRLRNKDATLRKLQVDATIQYIFLNKTGKVKEPLLFDDLKLDDPYNTYLYEGLPPGPICSPGQASIEAALYPESNKYLYYVAKADGGHIFSKTYSEHLKAVKTAQNSKK